MPEVICPYCDLRLELTKEELYGEKWIFCWYCSDVFENLNYNQIDNTKKIIVEENTTLF